MQNKRIEWIDIAKGIAMICVILVHVEEGFLNHTTLPTLKIPIYTFHLPVFFFVSGYLFSPKSSFKEFLKNKCRRLLIPYACLGGVLCVFVTCWDGEDFLKNLWELLLQNRKWTLWFIACLFLLNMLFYFLDRFIKNEKLRAVAVAVIAAAGIIYNKNGGEGIYWNIDVCATALPFFYVGSLCKKSDFINQKLLTARFKGMLFVGLVVIDFVSTSVNYRITEEYLEFFHCMYGIAPLAYIGSFAGIFALIILADKCRRIKPLRYIGENSMLFYAWHQTMLIPLLKSAIIKFDLFRFRLSPTKAYYLRIFLSTLLICVVSALLNEIIRRIKLGFMVGKQSGS